MNERYETFTVLIGRINRNIRKIKNQEMAQYNLRSAHVSCLYYLYLSDNLTATELCEKCEEDKATVSRALLFLEKNGYIFCKSKSAKRYKAPIYLTDSGKEIGRKIADKIGTVLSEINNGLTDDERTEFYRCLNVISNELDGVSKKYDS